VPPPYPTVWQAVKLVLYTMILMGLAGIALLGGTKAIGLELDGATLTSLTNLLAIGMALWLAVRSAKRPLREIFPFAAVPYNLWLPVALTLIGWQVVASEMDNMLRSVLPPPDWVYQAFAELQSSGPSSFLLFVVVAPVTEELLFRGAILQGFVKRYTVRKALLVSAVLFACLHMNPWQFAPAMVAGLVLGWWCLRTGSLWPALVGHAFANGFGLAVEELLGLEVPGLTGDPSTMAFQPLWLDVLGLTMFGLGLWLAARRLQPPREGPPLPGGAAGGPEGS
jgi:membrane protease YdiL (CAAX protease family)